MLVLVTIFTIADDNDNDTLAGSLVYGIPTNTYFEV